MLLDSPAPCQAHPENDDSLHVKSPARRRRFRPGLQQDDEEQKMPRSFSRKPEKNL